MSVQPDCRTLCPEIPTVHMGWKTLTLVIRCKCDWEEVVKRCRKSSVRVMDSRSAASFGYASNTR
jgi:hypothetical protein